MIVQPVTIPVYQKVGDKFVIISENVYTIKYLKGQDTNSLEIVVNNKPSGCYVNLTCRTCPTKRFILKAISKYVNGFLDKTNETKKGLSIKDLKKTNKNRMIRSIENHLLRINKEINRDTLTEFNLI